MIAERFVFGSIALTVDSSFESILNIMSTFETPEKIDFLNCMCLP